MPNERNYLDDLPGVSGYAFGKFRLDDLDFADDPLKRKIDFIDDALLAPPKPGADITSGIKTSREVMGERKPQPTDEVGMRPEDYIRRRPASHFHEEHEDRFAEERAPEPVKARAGIRDVTEPPVRTAAESRTRPTGEALEEAYRRYKERKQAEASASSQWNFPGTAPVRYNDSLNRGRLNAAGRTAQVSSVNGRRKSSLIVVITVFIIVMVVIQIFSFMLNLFSSETSTSHEPSGFVEYKGDSAEDWMEVQERFIELCEDTDDAKDLVGSTVYDIGITDEMIQYLLDEADKVSEEDDCVIYEKKIGDYDIDYYEYENYAWLRFWSDRYDDVADIAFYFDDMVIQVVDVNGERVADLTAN